MKQIRILTTVIALLFATGTFAQSGQGNDNGSHQASGQGLPTVDVQLKILAEKLSLTGDQQTKVKPVLQELHDATLKLMHDEKLSQEERLDRVRPLRLSADKKIRKVLNDDQKNKLDQYEHGPHSEMHGDLHGTPASTPPQP
jgi:Spy/CpxP family protein refolding chaperone